MYVRYEILTLLERSTVQESYWLPFSFSQIPMKYNAFYPSNTKRRLLDLKTQFELHSKHFSSRL